MSRTIRINVYRAGGEGFGARWIDGEYISGPLETADGREKIVCSGVEEQVRAFLEDWAPRNGLVDCYGDPARGFAGGYLS